MVVGREKESGADSGSHWRERERERERVIISPETGRIIVSGWIIEILYASNCQDNCFWLDN